MKVDEAVVSRSCKA